VAAAEFPGSGREVCGRETLPLDGFGRGDIGQAGCDAQKRYPLQRRMHRCNAAPLCGWGPARQMARSPNADGLSIK
jgi:hypothetical protein